MSSSYEERLADLIEAVERDPNYDIDRHLQGDPDASRIRAALSGLIAEGIVSLQPEGYEVLEEVARGGMGVVYRGWDRALRREVALKQIRPDLRGLPAVTEPMKARFRREAQVGARVQHSNALPVYALTSVSDGSPMLVTRLLAGRTLHECVEERVAAKARFQRGELDVIFAICGAVGAAHDVGVVHRDVKPQNIVVEDSGAIYLIDWGVARFVDGDPEQARGQEARASCATSDGSVIGSPSYMAPEQAKGELDRIDHRTDVFGVGATLYHLVTGNPPYFARSGGDGEGPDILDSAARAELTDPKGASARRPGVARQLLAVARKAMAGDPAMRYPSVSALAEDLNAFLGRRSGRAWRDGPIDRLVNLSFRRPALATLVGAVMLLAALVSVGLSISGERDRLARSQRERTLAQERLRLADTEASTRVLAVRRFGQSSRESLEVLRDWGVDLRADSPIASSVRAIRSQPDHVREELTGLLLQFLLHTGYAGLGMAAHWSSMTEASDLHPAWVEMASQHREVVAAWPLACRLARAVVVSDQTREAVAVWQQFQGDRSVVISVPDQAGFVNPFEAYFQARVAEFVLGRDVAVTLYRQVIHLDPSNVWVHNRLGKLLLETRSDGSFDPDSAQLALSHLSAAYALWPDAVVTSNNLAVAYEAVGRVDDAAEVLRRAVGTFPRLENTYNLGRLEQGRGNYGEAIRLLRQALDRSSDDLDVLLALGDCLLSVGEVTEAITRLRRAAELDSSCIEQVERMCTRALGEHPDNSELKGLSRWLTGPAQRATDPEGR